MTSGSETTAVYDATGNTAITSGGPYADGQAGTAITEQFFPPQTCYELVVSDGGSNGITDGGATSCTTVRAGASSWPAALSVRPVVIANGNDFCLP